MSIENTVSPASDECTCCGLSAPTLAVAEVKCGWSLEDFDSSFDAKIDPIAHMRFHNWGSPYLFNHTDETEGYTYCNTGPLSGSCSTSTRSVVYTDVSFVFRYNYSEESGCERIDDVISGSAEWYETAQNCFGPVPPAVGADASGPAVISAGGGLKGISWTGTIGYISRTDFFLSLPLFPPTCGVNTDSRTIAKTTTPLGIRQTFTRATSSSTANAGCAEDDTCNHPLETIHGYDTPDDYRLRFTFTPQNAHGANWCRVLATVYFTPWNIATETWGAEVEVDSIDFKWKPGEDPHCESFPYTDLGKFRIGPVRVYLAAQGRPDVYLFEP